MADEKGPKDDGSPGTAAGETSPRGPLVERKVDRRDVLIGLSTVPALGLFGYAWSRQRGYEARQKEAAALSRPQAPPDLKEINVALIGAGAQGQVLLDAMLRIPGLRFRAVCDIWKEYNQKRAVNTLRKFKFPVNGYEDYREMLDKEKDVEAVVIATPDFWHAQHTVDCLKAGKHVYCEKEMSNTLEGARQMVLAARETGRLLQIGHQRRSHPRYLHCYEKLLGEARLLGRVVTVNGQWNRAVAPDLGFPERYAIPPERLKQYGFKDMHQFRNWRWFRGKGGGPIVDLGSHQIDIYNWFLGVPPTSVTASGGLDYYDPKTHEWYDTVMAIYEYELPAGRVRAYYQTQTTNGSQGYFENFMGDQGTLVLSESEANYPGFLYRDPNAPAWDEWVQKGYISAPKLQETKVQEEGAVLDVRESVSPDLHRVPVVLRDPYHQPHLENFFDSIRGTAKLHCPAEVGYESAATVLKVNEAIEARQRLSFRPEEFRV
jgi:predicted dehydrogenase